MNNSVLWGYMIGVTALEGADEQISQFEAIGATVVHGPVSSAVDALDDDQLVELTSDVLQRRPSAVVVVSDRAFRRWAEVSARAGLADDLARLLDSTPVWARGFGSVAALASIGCIGDNIMAFESFGDLPERTPRAAPSSNVAVVHGGLGLADAEAARAAGWRMTEIVPSIIRPVADPSAVFQLVEQWSEGNLDAVTFASTADLDHLWGFAQSAGVDLDRLRSPRTVLACLRASTARRAEALGFNQVVTAAHPRRSSLVSTCASVVGQRTRELHVADRPLRIQGRQVVVGSKTVRLSGREAMILDLLSENPGVVIPKTQLLRDVWGPTATDPHVVEVAIARLRNRLGPAGSGIQTVIQRGYRLATEVEEDAADAAS